MNTLYLHETAVTIPRDSDDWNAGLSAGEKRRSPRIWQLAEVTVRALLERTDRQPASLLTATALGALDETVQFLKGVNTTGFGSPRNFIASVHNSMAGKLAIDHAIPGPNLTFCDSHNSLASALVALSALPQSYFPALVLVIDEYTEFFKSLQPHFTHDCTLFIEPESSDFCMAMCITTDPGSHARKLHAAGPVASSIENCDSDIEQLAEQLSLPDAVIYPLSQTSRNFHAPADMLNLLVSQNISGSHIIPAWSPTAQTCSVISLCA